MENKILFKRVFIVLFGILLVTGVFADTNSLGEEISEAINNVLYEKGISEENITSVLQVDYNNLPPSLDIKNIDKTNLAIYEVEIGEDKPLYVITASETLFEKASKPSTNKAVSFLNFGYSGEMKKKNEFLNTATGVETGLEKGYVMMREGSLTGISTNLEIVRGEGNINVVVYINGEAIEFGNEFISGEGIKKDYDVQSEGTVKFEAGDIISVSVEAENNVICKDVITMIEIITIR